MRLAVLGGGSWGTALANHLASSSHEVVLWCDDNRVVEDINSNRKNTRFFNDLPLNEFTATLSIGDALEKADFLVYALPAKAVIEVSKSIHSDLLFVVASKGIPPETGWLVSKFLSDREVVILSGPSFAQEVIKGKPTAVVAASVSVAKREIVAEAFHHNHFRVYSSEDVVGVELGGVLKNIYAIAAGVVDGLELGPNSRSALVTRALAEMSRLIVSEGGQIETVYGLSGLGDLVLTSGDNLSRNRRLGLLLSEGSTVEEAQKSLGQVAEGSYSAELILRRAKDKNIEMPIAEEVTNLLQGKSTPAEALDRLFGRTRKPESSIQS